MYALVYMAKITITIADKDNGKIGIIFDPPVSELKDHVKKVGIENVSMIYHYAKACQAVCAYISDQLDKQDPNESKEKSKIWLPAMEKVAGIFK